MVQSLVLLPAPQRLNYLEGALELEPGRFIWLADGVPLPIGRAVRAALAVAGPHWTLTAARLDGRQIGASIRLDPTAVLRAQGYTLSITPQGIEIVAHDRPGAFYAAMTLTQIARQMEDNRLPCLQIEDWPDFPSRGVMLDISRDKVPTMDTLYGLIDRLASWKINQLQLYTEHTFAYRNHTVVWAEASPMTGEEILELDAFCRERYIELVPNQNSFGHMLRWLKHPAYAHLAEAPNGFTFPWGRVSREPFSLCPTDPGSLALLAELYEELLPHFSSRQFNVGCDETWDVGQPGTRSEAIARQKGAGRVYLDFLRQIHDLVTRHGRTMQFWGDIIIKHPDLIPELPADTIALEWGYEADHPFDEHGAAFAASGIPFYVCPGTSSWLSIAGRTANALANLWSAAENGLKHGAIGYLNTDWGDYGHWQPLPVSYLGFAYGAAVSWAAAANRTLDVPAALDHFAFQDEAGVMGQLAYDLGNVYQLAGVLGDNRSALHGLLMHADVPLGETWMAGLKAENLARAQAAIEEIMLRLDSAQIMALDADLIMDEFDLAANLLLHACKLGQAQLAAPGQKVTNIPGRQRKRLAEELEPLLDEYRRIWLARNRPGGLADSIARLEKLLALYHQA
ncbi:MAG: family 20 glycosylhydrolase [Anaerolineae bacterium]|nr:family 20 glycosylhydrolase [Anaerolineae bacterium]